MTRLKKVADTPQMEDLKQKTKDVVNQLKSMTDIANGLINNQLNDSTLIDSADLYGVNIQSLKDELTAFNATMEPIIQTVNMIG